MTAQSWYTSAEAARLSGLTYRQVDNVVRTGQLTPSIRLGRKGGSKNGRLFSASDIVALTIIRLLDFDSGAWFPSWLPATVQLIQAETPDTLAGRNLIVEHNTPRLLNQEDTGYYLNHLGRVAVIVVPLDQCLRLLFDPAGMAS